MTWHPWPDPSEPGAAHFELPPGEAHVWYAWTGRCTAPEQLRYYRSLLTADEADRLERLAFEPLRREFLLARALCRHTLSRYADIAPPAWRFASNRHGRPHVAMPDGPHWLRFNLSHARSLVACVVARDAEVGVDVEECGRDVDALDIARRFFAPSEADALAALPPESQRRRFFEQWTLKEAYVKALGGGLSIGLDRFSIALDGPRPLRVAFDDASGRTMEPWRLGVHAPSADHVMAVCLQSETPDRARIRVIEVAHPAGPVRASAWIDP